MFRHMYVLDLPVRRCSRSKRQPRANSAETHPKQTRLPVRSKHTSL